MPKVAGITGEYIQVRREEKGIVTYGGDQGFFRGAAASSVDDRKRRMGCGIVALGDLLLYLAARDPVYCMQENESYVNRILSQQEYMTYYNSIYKRVGGLPAGKSNGLSGFRLQRTFNRMARLEGWKLHALWGFSGKKLYGRMVEMLSRDIPVILCVPLLLFSRDPKQEIPFYKKTEGQYHKVCSVSAHYVVVTEILEEQEGIFLGISSWGVKYYINWNAYDRLLRKAFLGTILGNILYIK